MTLQKEYKWDRYWCLSSQNYILDHRGFLLDPEDSYYKYYESGALRFDDIPEMPCLVLLGEPGIGKTKALDEIFNLHQAKSDTKAIRIDLRSYETDDGLVSDLRDNPEIKNWIDSNYLLTLFFDSLDECMLNVRTTATVLIDRVIKDWPYQRLKLRFVCRTVDWPKLLDNELCSLYGLKEIPKYELLPLRQKDVITAAFVEGIDSNNFLEEISKTDVAAFANRPITLKFLLNAYKEDGHLPKQKSEIYWHGCLHLCEEKNKSRVASKQTGMLNSTERLIVAARIAAVMLLSKKTSIWLDNNDVTIPNGDLTAKVLSGFHESFKDISIAVTENAIKETLGTGLFSSRGNAQMGFAHQTYAEYLAAYYLNSPQIAHQKIFELILHPTGKVIPQLQELAVWLSAFSIEVLEKLLSVQPDLILRVDPTVMSDAQKKILVDSLFRAYESKELVDVLDTVRFLDHIDYEELGDQITPILKDSEKSFEVRNLAILIVRECKITQLIDLLILLALDATENYRLRKYAAHTIEIIGDEDEKAKLLPLALNTAKNDDPQDELKGIALMAVWPKHTSIEDLLKSITPMKESDLIGTYYGFLDHDFAAGLSVMHLPKVLNWIINEMPVLGSEIVTDNLIVSVMRKGWDNIEIPEVTTIFAKLVHKRLLNYAEARSYSKDKSYLNEISGQPQKRRLLIESLVRLADKHQDAFYLFSTTSPIVMYEDLEWVNEKIKLEDNSEKRLIWAQILFYLVDRGNQDDISQSYSLYETYPEVAEIFKPMFAPVELESEQAKSLRKYSKVSKEAEDKHNGKDATAIDHQSRLLEYLEQFEQGDSNAWWMLNLLFLSSDPNRPGNEFDADLSSFSLWTQISDEAKYRLVSFAERYIHEHQACTIYTEDRRVYRPAISAFRAFYLIALKNPARLNEILPNDWNKWAPVILSFPVFDSQNNYDIKIHQILMSELFETTGDEIYSLLEEEIKTENKTGYLQILKLLENIDSNDLQKLFVSLLKEESLEAYPFEQLLGYLLERNNAESKELAFRFVKITSSWNDTDKQKRLKAAKTLILNTNDANWSLISSEIKNDIDFGKDLFQSLAHMRDNLAVLLVSKLQELEVADLYIWLENHFPSKDDPKVKGFHSVSERESVGQFRNSLISALSNKGSELACQALSDLIEKYPDREWLLPYLRQCEKNYRQNTWEPLQPYKVLEMLWPAKEEGRAQGGRNRRLVNIVLTILNILATTLSLILPNTIDYKKSDVLNFFVSHQYLTWFLLVISAIVLVWINTRSSYSE